MSNFKLKYLDSLLESDYIISPQKMVNDLWGSNAHERMEFSFFRKISSNLKKLLTYCCHSYHVLLPMN